MPSTALCPFQAEGTSEHLREETERRAALFNAAVQAAVSRIKSVSHGLYMNGGTPIVAAIR